MMLSMLSLPLHPPRSLRYLVSGFIEMGVYILRSQDLLQLPLMITSTAAHCTAGYLVTPLGMRPVATQWLEGDRAVFHCAANELTHNVALVADRLLNQAASSQGAIGYACSAPLATTVAFDSTIKSSRDSTHKPARLAGRQEARDMALTWFDALKPSQSR